MENKNLVLYIENFQRVKKARMEFVPGVNIITGCSNQGKSAIMRAFGVAVLNLSRPDSITFGESKQVIGIKFNGHEIIYRRDASGASPVKYKVDDTVLTKVGRGQLEEVAKALGIREVDLENEHISLFYQKQMKYPFLLDHTGSQIFKFVAGASGEEKVLDVVKKMKQDLTKKAQDIVRMEGHRDSLKEQAGRLKSQFAMIQPKLDTCDKVLDIEPEVKKVVAIDSDIKYVESAESNLKSLNATVEFDKKRLAVVEESLPKMQEIIDKTNGVSVLVADITVKSQDLERVNSDCAIKKSDLFLIEKKEPILKKLLEDIDQNRVKSDAVKNIISAIQLIESSISKVNAVISKERDSLTQVETEIKSIPVCPYCGSTLEEGHSHE